MALTLTSPAFEHEGTIPDLYTCDGDNTNPELHIGGVPEGVVSLVLLSDDPDIPDYIKKERGIEKFDHWVLFNISPKTEVIDANSVPEGAVVGLSSANTNTYRGPCPPDSEHRYFFNLYAIDEKLSLTETATLDQVREAIEGHIIEETVLMGRYNRPENR